MATSILSAFSTGHSDMMHDAQLDFYGRRLATCGADHCVKVFDVEGGAQTGEIAGCVRARAELATPRRRGGDATGGGGVARRLNASARERRWARSVWRSTRKRWPPASGRGHVRAARFFLCAATRRSPFSTALVN